MIDDWKHKYDHCPICGKEHTQDMKDWSYRQHEQKCCSTECRRKEVILRNACCSKAVQINCVCMYAFKCPDHGERHIGTHD